MFDPAKIADDACADGHLDRDPIYAVLLALGQQLITGRLTIDDAAGENHMYFMQGRPVGVHLAEHFHPLGQLLLELGRMSGATFVRAQRLIAEGNRLPGQVYKELGILDDASLKDVLAIQARRKAEHFCRLGSRAFRFCRGLTYLTGFTSTPLDPHAVIFLAVRQQMGEQSRENWLEAARGEQVRLVPPGGSPPEGADSSRPLAENFGLPAPPQNFGFGPPEERFLQRLLAGFEGVVELQDTGTLPREEMAVLLRYLEVIGRLHRRPVPKRAPTPTPVDAFIPAHVPQSAPRQISALIERPVEVAELKNIALAEPTSDDVFSKPKPAPAGGTVPRLPPQPFALADAPTDPKRPAVTKDELNRPETPSVVISEELPAPVVRKKKVKRTEPLPSEGSGLLASETRKEKTMIAQLPSIVIEDE